MQLLSALGGGLWVIPVGLLLASIWSFYRGYRSSKSNSTLQNGFIGVKDNTGNVPIWETSGFIFGCGFLIASLGSFFWMLAEK